MKEAMEPPKKLRTRTTTKRDCAATDEEIGLALDGMNVVPRKLAPQNKVIKKKKAANVVSTRKAQLIVDKELADRAKKNLHDNLSSKPKVPDYLDLSDPSGDEDEGASQVPAKEQGSFGKDCGGPLFQIFQKYSKFAQRVYQTFSKGSRLIRFLLFQTIPWYVIS